MSHGIAAGPGGSIADCCMRGSGGGEERRKKDEHLPHSDIAPWSVSTQYLEYEQTWEIASHYLAGLHRLVQMYTSQYLSKTDKILLLFWKQ